jgi:signal transduction histidine kinase
MPNNRLFYRMRSQLAVAYAGVMGVILLLCGYAAHVVMERAFSRAVDREINILAVAIDDKLKMALQAPGKLSLDAQQLLPGLCPLNQDCLPGSGNAGFWKLSTQGYYLRLLDISGNAMPWQPLCGIASIGDRPNRFAPNPHLDHSYDAKDSQGKLYHLHLIPLKNESGNLWGYLQIGRSLQNLNDYMHSLHLLLFLGVPLTVVTIGGASWWLAGLAMRPIQQSYVQIQQFTADAAHELRTPIAAARTIVETALTEPELLTPQSQEVLQALHRQVKRLGDLTQDLLLLSRLEHDNLDFSTCICLNELIQDVEEELIPLALASQISLSINIPKEANYVTGNESQMYRLLINLVSNGIKYSSAGGIVNIELIPDGNWTTINIKDTGVGIAASDLPHIFNRFYRVNSDRSRQSGGAGLGLAIALAIVRAHGGKLKAESHLGMGSTFKVVLPSRVTS